MENHLVPTSEALGFSAIKNLLELEFLIHMFIGPFVVSLILQLLEGQICLNDVLDRHYSVCKRAHFRRK